MFWDIWQNCCAVCLALICFDFIDGKIVMLCFGIYGKIVVLCCGMICVDDFIENTFSTAKYFLLELYLL